MATAPVIPPAVIVSRVRASLSPRLERRLRTVLAGLALGPVSVRVDFRDDNGPKGGRALRCTLTARLPRRRPLRVEAVDVKAHGALDQALERLERRIRRHRERTREARRRPKKYYAARRLLREETSDRRAPDAGGP
jgi:ribosome-associated translation inhibitor RaiA